MKASGLLKTLNPKTLKHEGLHLRAEHAVEDLRTPGQHGSMAREVFSLVSSSHRHVREPEFPLPAGFGQWV